METRPDEYAPEQPSSEQPLPVATPIPATPEPAVPVPGPEPVMPEPMAPVPAPASVQGAPIIEPVAPVASEVATPEVVAPEPVIPPVAPEPEPMAIPVAAYVTPEPAVAPLPQPTMTSAPLAPTPVPPAAPVVPAPIAQPKQKKPLKAWAVILIAVVVSALVGAAVAAGVAGIIAYNKSNTVSTSSPGSTITVKGESSSLSEVVAKKALPSVVSITVDVAAQSSNPFSGGGTTTTQDSGSGVIIKPNGYIVTNNHVISGGTKIVVNAGGKNYTAKVVGADTGTDIAVLKIDATNLPAIQIGTSKDLNVGQYVMAIGCPFGLEKSVSTGVVSGLGRSDLMSTQTYVTAYTNLIQTDAAINPGNSGGALVDQNAHLVGINTLISSTSGSSAGVGFAIPIDTAIDIANQIMTTGKVVHPFLGVSSQTITSDVAQAYNMPVQEGAYVVGVSSGSPAAAAGLKQGDIIVQINSTKITSSDDVFTAVRSQKIGDTITITFYRDNKKQTTTAKLASDAANQAQQQQQEQQLQQQQQDSSGSGLDNSGSDSSGSGSTTDPHSGYTQQQLQDLLNQLQQGGGGSGN